MINWDNLKESFIGYFDSFNFNVSRGDFQTEELTYYIPAIKPGENIRYTGTELSDVWFNLFQNALLDGKAGGHNSINRNYEVQAVNEEGEIQVMYVDSISYNVTEYTMDDDNNLIQNTYNNFNKFKDSTALLFNQMFSSDLSSKKVNGNWIVYDNLKHNETKPYGKLHEYADALAKYIGSLKFNNEPYNILKQIHPSLDDSKIKPNPGIMLISSSYKNAKEGEGENKENDDIIFLQGTIEDDGNYEYPGVFWTYNGERLFEPNVFIDFHRRVLENAEGNFIAQKNLGIMEHDMPLDCMTPELEALLIDWDNITDPDNINEMEVESIDENGNSITEIQRTELPISWRGIL